MGSLNPLLDGKDIMTQKKKQIWKQKLLWLFEVELILATLYWAIDCFFIKNTCYIALYYNSNKCYRLFGH